MLFIDTVGADMLPANVYPSVELPVTGAVNVTVAPFSGFTLTFKVLSSTAIFLTESYSSSLISILSTVEFSNSSTEIDGEDMVDGVSSSVSLNAFGSNEAIAAELLIIGNVPILK